MDASFMAGKQKYFGLCNMMVTSRDIIPNAGPCPILCSIDCGGRNRISDHNKNSNKKQQLEPVAGVPKIPIEPSMMTNGLTLFQVPVINNQKNSN